MAFSVHTYEGDGTDRQLTINFTLGFLSREDVHAYVDGEETERTITWINDGLITIGAVSSGTGIIVRRETTKTALQHDFSDGAVIGEQELDESNLQTIMLVHEILDGFRDPAFARRSDEDMNGYQFINLGAPVEATNAVRLQDLPGILQGDTLVVKSVEEAKVLADGQTTVVFDTYSTAGAAFYMTGSDIDNGRALSVNDYTLVSSTTIELGESYPAGTTIILVRGEILDTTEVHTVETLDFQANTYAELELLVTPANRAVYCKGRTTIGDGGEGTFVWDSSDMSTEVAADSQRGIYVALSSDLTGASGAWVRQYSGAVNVKWFGASESNANNRAEIQGALDTAYAKGASTYLPNGTYLIKPETTLGRLLLIRGTDVVVYGESQDGAILKVAATDEDGSGMNDAGGTIDPNGYVGMFTPTVGNDDVSRFNLYNLTIDLNAEDNHLVEGYGNSGGIEPLEGVYPGSSEIYLARFRAAVYILVGDDIRFEKVTLKNPQRVGFFCDGSSLYGDIKRATATNCKVDITVTNPGTRDWDVTGVLLIGDSCACTNSIFTNTATGTDYYLARTAMEITGPGARVCNNYVNRWHRIALVGNSALGSIARTIVCSNNNGLNLQRSIQLLSRAGTVVTSGEAGVGIVVDGNSASFSLTMALNTPLATDLTGIGMHEIETLGLDLILISNNIHEFPAGATFGGAAIHIVPTAAGTQKLLNLHIKNNIAKNPPQNGVKVAFADTMDNLSITGNQTTNPGQISGAADRDKAGVQVRGLVKRALVNGNKTFDDQVVHTTSANVWFTPSAGSKEVECLDNAMFLADGNYVEPLVEVENANLSPVIGGVVDTFIQPTWYVGNGSKVVETSSYLTYRIAVNNLWYSEIAKGLSVSFVTFINGDTTPSVKGMSWAIANNSGVTTITDFDDPHEGQKLAVFFGTGSTIIQHGTHIFTKTGANVTPAINTTMNFLYVAANWYEI